MYSSLVNKTRCTLPLARFMECFAIPILTAYARIRDDISNQAISSFNQFSYFQLT